MSGGVVAPTPPSATDHPVCAAKERDHFFMAQPPLLFQEGKSLARNALFLSLGTGSTAGASVSYGRSCSRLDGCGGT